jgi:hypothetical protein
MPFFWGAIYGLGARLLFSGDIMGGLQHMDTMSTAFAVIVPVVVGAITIYMAEKITRRNVLFYIFAPWLSVTMFVTGTAAALIEGSICIAMALPMFLGLASLGGLAMGIACRLLNKPVRSLQSVVIMPFLFALAQTGQPLTEVTRTISRSVYISSTPEAIWSQITSPGSIHSDEVKGGIAYHIGVPYPVKALLNKPGVGGVRHSVWQRGVSFDEIITHWEQFHKISWQYKFTADSFPPGSMDDHVVVGGRYFKLDNTSYTLTSDARGTRLDIEISYRVNTGFNWYAVPMAKFLISNEADTLLNFYKHRTELERVKG